MNKSQKHSASFRDPSGFIFHRDGTLYRQVNQIYRENYDLLMSSGLYATLTQKGLIIPHHEVDLEPENVSLAYRIIKPDPVTFISYPYEWSFSQLKDAALATLRIQKLALEAGMSLKDASAYNIQFHNGKPVMIDTLSFEKYEEGKPWVAYRQFCQHFLSPLALMAYRDIRLSQLLRVYIDGVPLDLTSKLLPAKTRWNMSLMTHIHLHAAVQQRYSDKEVNKANVGQRFSKVALLGLVDSLEGAVKRLTWKPVGTEWAEYYSDTNYTNLAQDNKAQLVKKFIEQIKPGNVWDVGANNGYFSRIASDAGIPTIALDIDPAAVEQNYRACISRKEKNMLPLVMDLTNPSPAIGWQNKERSSMMERGPADAVLALAVIHHLAISNNVPLPQLAEFFCELGKWLIIEFVPKSDSQVQRLLTSREDIFTDYNVEKFTEAFQEKFTIHEVIPIQDSQRALFLMERK
jgi:hypothetical protein